MAQVIDPRGDLILVVGGDTAASENPTTSRFLVCSRTLARTSPVFAAMLYGGFAESKPSSPPVPGREWFVRLPGDDCAAMQQLLHLLHGNHDRFTLEPTFDSLYYYLDSDAGNKYAIPQTHSHHENIQLVYDFLVAADKYDCEQYVHLWTPRWHLEVCGVTSYPLKAMLMLAWIFYQLGDRKRYEWMLKCLAFDHESPRVMTEPLPIALPPNLICECFKPL